MENRCYLKRHAFTNKSEMCLTSSSQSSLTSMLGFTSIEPWLLVSMKLCLFGLLKEFRPSEPFITDYLKNPPMNFTSEQVIQDIYPIGTYANLVQLVFVFLITDYLRYKPLIVIDALSGFFVYVLLIVCRSLFAMQVMEVIYGLFMAGEVAYYTYIYAKVDKKHFHEVTSHTRTAYLVGRGISGLVSQLMISMKWLSYYHLQFLTAGGLLFATFWALSLPSVETSVYFHRTAGGGQSTEAMKRNKSLGNVFKIMLKDLKYAVCNLYVLNLLVWSIVATAGFYQVFNYVQTLWEDVSKSSDKANDVQTLWNGAVEFTYTVLGALATLAVGKMKFNWHKFANALLVVNAIVLAAMLFIMSQTRLLWVAYLTYIVFMAVYQGTMTIVNSEIAKLIREDSFGLVFGVAMFFSLLIQTSITLIVVSKSGFALPPRLQFVSYSVYFVALSAVLILKVVISAVVRRVYRKGDTISVAEDSN